MIIGIDASRSCDSIQKTGVERVSDELLRHLLTDVTLPTIQLYTPELITWLPQTIQRVLPGRTFWTFIHLSREMLIRKPDVLFVPVHTLPFFCPKKTIKVVHDISSIKYPHLYTLKERWLLRWDLWRTKRLCTSVIVPTESVKHDLVELLGFTESKILVTGWGASHTASEILPVDQRKPYFLYIGRLEEKKNIRTMVTAFKQFHSAHPEWKFILVGKPGYGFQSFEHELIHPAIDVRGYIQEEEKYKLLHEAAGLVLVSHDEGFSFPLLEAFAEGTPTIISSKTPLLDISGGSSLAVQPHSIEEINKALTSLAEDKRLAEDLQKAGLTRPTQFSWKLISQKIAKLLTY